MTSCFALNVSLPDKFQGADFARAEARDSFNNFWMLKNRLDMKRSVAEECQGNFKLKTVPYRRHFSCMTIWNRRSVHITNRFLFSFVCNKCIDIYTELDKCIYALFTPTSKKSFGKNGNYSIFDNCEVSVRKHIFPNFKLSSIFSNAFLLVVSKNLH